MRKNLAVGVVALALVSAAPVAGQNRKSVVGDAQLGFMETLQTPEVTCAGGEPTGLSFPVCSEGTQRILGRNEVQLWVPATLSDPIRDLLTGTITFVVNCTFNPEYRGPCWGTFEWEVPGVGLWTGSWVAPVMDLVTYESKLSMVGFGAGGQIDGMQLKFDGGSAPGDWYISGQVRIH